MDNTERTKRVKKIMYLNRRAPYGTIYAQEGLEAVLIGSAFDQDVCIVYVDDGVYQLKKGQNPAEVEMKNFSRTYRALEDYGIDKLYVDRKSMEDRGLSKGDFYLRVDVLDSRQLSEMMEKQDIILNF